MRGFHKSRSVMIRIEICASAANVYKVGLGSFKKNRFSFDIFNINCGFSAIR